MMRPTGTSALQGAEDVSRTMKIGIAWKIGSTFGWGVYGTQIALNLIAGGRGTPVLMEAPAALDLSPVEERLLAPTLAAAYQLQQRMQASYLGGSIYAPMDVLHALGNNAEHVLASTAERPRGNRNHGLIFFEDPRFGGDALERLQAFHTVIAGSTWNGRILEEHGLDNVRVRLQGIDPSVFHPAPANGLLKDRFVIFAGGKLEFRKGQDIVAAAVRRFRQRHPETLLIAAWHNHWPKSDGVRHLAASPHLDAAPETGADGRLMIQEWLAANGLPPDAALVVPEARPGQLARLMREADVGLFPNRCEGGTNLVAMECMACGVPCILSANTGHLDIIADGACLPLSRQDAVVAPVPDVSTRDWGESSIDEILERLEDVHSDRERARMVGRRGAAFMTGFSWATRAGALFDLLIPAASSAPRT